MLTVTSGLGTLMPSYLDRTGPAVGSVKDRTRAYTGLVQFKDRLCNRTAINRLNRPVFHQTGEPGGSIRTGGFLIFFQSYPSVHLGQPYLPRGIDVHR